MFPLSCANTTFRLARTAYFYCRPTIGYVKHRARMLLLMARANALTAK